MEMAESLQRQAQRLENVFARQRPDFRRATLTRAEVAAAQDLARWALSQFANLRRGRTKQMSVK
jgi:hypothetical protein